MKSTPLRSSCRAGCLFFHKLQLSMEHQRRVRIDVPPHSEAGFCFGPRCEEPTVTGIGTQVFTVTSSALRYPAIAKIYPLEVYWMRRALGMHVYLWCVQRECNLKTNIFGGGIVFGVTTVLLSAIYYQLSCLRGQVDFLRRFNNF